MESYKILKEGETGYGFLVESDAGYVSGNDNKNKLIIESYEIAQDKDIILYAILQKADTENKNGRVYPYDVLKREVERYKKMIGMGVAVSELNHPECVPGDTEVLTKDGWKQISILAEDEEIYTLNPDTNSIELNQINRYVKEHYKGDMIHIKGRNIDITTTPNHRFWIINSNNGKGKFITAQEILDTEDLKDFYIPKMDKRSFQNPTETQIKEIFLDKEDIKVEKVQFDDFVYCVNVDNHIFYVRNNNKGLWTGNSSIISLDRISHEIIEIWMEGNIVWGKLKVLTSPGFKKFGNVGNYAPDIAANLLLHGITLGISSRGVGSVEKRNGKNIVQNDFELICFDLVHSPSTPGAYLMKDKSEAERLKESIINEKEKLLIDKLNKFIL